MLQLIKRLITLKKETLILILILSLAAFLRFYRIGDNPPSLNWDEVSHGFNAYSILKTGRDEWGIRFPLIFRAYGDFKLPLYIYLTTIPVGILGLNSLAVRLISVLSGIGLAVVAYLLGKKLTQNETGGLIAALLTAVSPWSLFVSRIAVEANLAAFLFALGFWLLLKDRLFLTLIFWGLSLHSYNSARVLVPIMILIIVGRLMKSRQFVRLITTLAIFFIFALPVIKQILDRSGGARFFWVSPIDQGAINRIIEKRLASSLPPVLTRLIYNRPVYFVGYSLRNYWAHFSPGFLFLRGGSHYQFSLPGQGLLYLIAAPFLILGLLGLIKKRNWWLLIWFLAAFIPSAITRDSPHVLRSLLVLPLPMVLTALGFWWVQNYLKERSQFGGRLVLATFVIGVLIQFGFWWRDYWRIYRPAYSWAWQGGYREAVSYVKEHYEQYQKIVFTKKYGEPHEFILFYWPWEPSYYQQDPKKVWDYHAHWYWVDAFDKFEFWNDWEVKEKLKFKLKLKEVLLITSPGNWIEGGKLLKTINFLDGSKAFEIVEY